MPYVPGSEADLERLSREAYRRIFGTLITLVRDRATAEDCAQETFERAYRSWASWRPDAPVEAAAPNGNGNANGHDKDKSHATPKGESVAPPRLEPAPVDQADTRQPVNISPRS